MMKQIPFFKHESFDAMTMGNSKYNAEALSPLLANLYRFPAGYSRWQFLVIL